MLQIKKNTLLNYVTFKKDASVCSLTDPILILVFTDVITNIEYPTSVSFVVTNTSYICTLDTTSTDNANGKLMLPEGFYNMEVFNETVYTPTPVTNRIYTENILVI